MRWVLIFPVHIGFRHNNPNNRFNRIFCIKHSHVISTELVVLHLHMNVSPNYWHIFFLCRSRWRTSLTSPKVIVFISATWPTWLILDLGVLAAPWSVWIFVSSNIYSNYFNYQQETVQTASENLKYHTPALCDVVIRDGVVNWCPIEQLLLWPSPWSGWGCGQKNCQQ